MQKNQIRESARVENRGTKPCLLKLSTLEQHCSASSSLCHREERDMTNSGNAASLKPMALCKKGNEVIRTLRQDLCAYH